MSTDGKLRRALEQIHKITREVLAATQEQRGESGQEERDNLAKELTRRWDKSGLFSKLGRSILVSSDDLKIILASLRSVPSAVSSSKSDAQPGK